MAFNFTSHADSTYKCGDHNTCQVVQVSVTNFEPFPIPYGWTLTLSKATWYLDYSVNTWWNCANCEPLPCCCCPAACTCSLRQLPATFEPGKAAGVGGCMLMGACCAQWRSRTGPSP